MEQQSKPGITREQLIAHAQAEAINLMNRTPIAEPDTAVRVKPLAQVLADASGQAIPQMLFGKLWYEGELCILFSDSNTGKSILAVQIGDNISSGKSMEPFDTEVAAQPVLYFDFELTAKQLEARYSYEWGEHYQFNKNFYRADLNPDTDIPKCFDYEEHLNASIERAICQTGAKVVIIDNLTYISSENEQAKFALPLMKHLKALKNQYDLSILALAHTPKRDHLKPITSNDLQGSKMLMNFCDSSFAIGSSNQHEQRRYLKQIKQRNTALVYGEENVCVFDIVKPHNFLKYDFIGNGDERVHLKERREKESDQYTAKAVELRQQGLSLREIAGQLNINFQKVDRLLKAAQREN